MRASSESALTISTTCCWATGQARTGVRGEADRRRAPRAARRSRSSIPRRSTTPRARLAAEEDVLGDGAVRQEVELLVDDRDAGLLAPRRVVERDLLAVDPDRALVGRVHAGEDLHQRRLAGAVLAHDRVDLAGRAGRGRRRGAPGRRGTLADPAHLEQRRAVRGAGLGCVDSLVGDAHRSNLTGQWAEIPMGDLEPRLDLLGRAAPDRVLVLDREDAVEPALVQGVHVAREVDLAEPRDPVAPPAHVPGIALAV